MFSPNDILEAKSTIYPTTSTNWREQIMNG